MSFKNFELINLNPTPVLVLKSDENIFTSDDIAQLKTLDLQTFTDQNLVKISLNNNILENPNLSRIKKIYDNAIKEYTQTICIKDEFKMTNSWLTKNEFDSEHHWHTHPNVMLSVVSYFYEDLTDDIFSGLILQGTRLERIFKDFNFTCEIEKWNVLNAENYTIIPKKNLLVVFPGYLKHKSLPNKNIKSRYCLGANYFINGTIKFDVDSYSNLNIKINA